MNAIRNASEASGEYAEKSRRTREEKHRRQRQLHDVRGFFEASYDHDRDQPRFLVRPLA